MRPGLRSLVLIGPTLLLAAEAATATATAAEPADLVVQHANVLTVNPRQPRATAFAVRGGTFVAVGSDDDVAPLAGPGTKRLDLAGKTVVPGFIDAHAHPRPAFAVDSRWYSVELGPDKVRTIDELIAALRRKAAITPAGAVVKGFGYHETKLGRHPTRYDLDRASSDHPIMITHSSGHLTACNSRALRLAGITRETKDPAGGRFARDADGEPTGLLEETAAGIVRGALPRADGPPEEETVAAYRNNLRAFVSHGITGVHVAGTDVASARLLGKAREAVPIRLYVMLREGAIDTAVQRKRDMAPDEAGLRFGAIKIFHGNALTGQTCWLYEPYAHDRNYYGIPPARSQDALNRLIGRIHDAGLQACVHTNGDREIDMVLDAFEAALKQSPRENHRHRLEHCSVVNERIVGRIKQLGLVVAPHSYIYEHGDKMDNYGQWRWKWMHANRSFLDAGIPIGGTSDFPVSTAEPLLHLQDMVTRTSAEGKVYGPEQRTTLEQALAVWTLGGAFASFEERVKGSIEPGKLADFVVLAADPARVDPLAIKDIAVEMTAIGGQVVYEQKSSPAP
jgi:predicted amidohydrolase YtcJ